jgi:hypothetical protein
MSFRNSTLALSLAVAGACFTLSQRARLAVWSSPAAKPKYAAPKPRQNSINFRRLPLPVGRGYVALQHGTLDTRINMRPDEAALIRL